MSSLLAARAMIAAPVVAALVVSLAGAPSFPIAADDSGEGMLPPAVLPGLWRAMANGDRVGALLREGDIVWSATQGGGVVRWDLATGEHQQFVAPQDGLPSNEIRDLVRHPDGALWAASAAGLARLDPGHSRWQPIRAQHPQLQSVSATTLAVDGEGMLWVGFEQQWDPSVDGPVRGSAGAFVGGGLARLDPFTGECLTVLRATPLDHLGLQYSTIPSDNVTAVALTESGQLWVGTRPYFVWEEGASGSPAAWIRRGGGLAATDGESWKQWLPVGPNEACLGSQINAIAVDSADRVWIGTAGRGLQVFRSGLASVACDYTEGHSAYVRQRGAAARAGIAGNSVWSLAIGDDERVWAGTGQGFDSGSGVSILEHGGTFEDPDRPLLSDDSWVSFGLEGRIDEVPALASALSVEGGELVAGTRLGDQGGDGWGIKRRSREGAWSTLATADSGLPSNRVTVVAVHPASGAIWVGTAGKGLARWDGRAWEHWRFLGPGEAVAAVADDVAAGELWVPTTMDEAVYAAAFSDPLQFVYFGDDPTRYEIVKHQASPDGIALKVEPALTMPARATSALSPAVGGPPSDTIVDIAFDRQGRTWVAGEETIWRGKEDGLHPGWLDGGVSVLDGGDWLPAAALGSEADLDKVTALAAGSDGRMWIGAEQPNQGREVALTVYDGATGTWKAHGPADGIGPGGVADIAVDPTTGELWVAHLSVVGCDPGADGCRRQRLGGGISHFDGATWEGWTRADGAAFQAFGDDGDFTTIVCDAGRDRVWAGAWAPGPDGFHWNSGFGIATTLNNCPRQCRAEEWSGRAFATDGPVDAMSIDGRGRLWVGANRERRGTIPPLAGVRILEADTWHALSAADSPLPVDAVTALAADGNSTWIGTYDRGMVHWREMTPVDWLHLPLVGR